MKKILALFLAITGLFSITYAQKAKTAPQSAMLYKISGKNLKNPSYIYGTIHVICQNDMFGMEKLNGYIEQSESVLMELDLDDPQELQAMGAGLKMPEGKTLNDFLTAEEYAKVDEMFKNYMGTSVDNVKSFKPFMLTVMIATSPKSMGCTPPGSYDLAFSQTAVAKKKPVEGLETAAEQFEKLSKNPLEKQAKDIYKMALNPQKSVDEFKQMIATYKSQDSEKLYKEMIGKFGDAEIEKVLLDERNKNWIPKIEKSIAEKSTFIAVGGGHLGGKNGVINLLKAKGYTVEAIKL